MDDADTGVRSAVDVRAIPPISHREAMEITAVENERLLDLIRGFDDAAWARPTDCERWDVRAMVLHLIGSADAQASIREFVRQVRTAKALTSEIGGHHWVDGMNERQIRDRSHLSDLPAAWERAAARALRARRRMPAPILAAPVLPIGPPIGRKPIGYLYSIGFTRDTWMHRVDLSRAVGLEMHTTAEHDGRIIADIVREWAALHREPFTLTLTGPAGGRYTSGTGGEDVELDAVGFVRILAGRAPGSGVLRHPLPL